MEEKPKVKWDVEARSGPCPICGGTEYAWGYLASKYYTKFVADAAPALSKLLNYGPGTRARACTRCGNVQLFLE